MLPTNTTVVDVESTQLAVSVIEAGKTGTDDVLSTPEAFYNTEKK
jgi:hypothetical protein